MPALFGGGPYGKQSMTRMDQKFDPFTSGKFPYTSRAKLDLLLLEDNIRLLNRIEQCGARDLKSPQIKITSRDLHSKVVFFVRSILQLFFTIHTQ